MKKIYFTYIDNSIKILVILLYYVSLLVIDICNIQIDTSLYYNRSYYETQRHDILVVVIYIGGIGQH